MKTNPKNPGSEKNLRRFGKELTGEKAKEKNRKGGKVKSLVKKEAAKAREYKKNLKKGRLTNTQYDWIIKRIEDSKAFATSLIEYVDEIREEADDVKTKAQVAGLYNQAMRNIHGDTIKVENRSVNLNVDVTADEVREHLDKLFGERE